MDLSIAMSFSIFEDSEGYANKQMDKLQIKNNHHDNLGAYMNLFYIFLF